MASRPDTCTIRIGTSTSSDNAIARWVASRSTTIGRESAWYFGAVWPADSSASVSQAMQSAFSAWTMASAPCWRATASSRRIWRSSSFMSS